MLPNLSSLPGLLAGVLGSLAAVSSALAGTFVGVAADRDGQALVNVVMSLKPVGRAAPASPPEQIVVSQEDLAFKPYISVIRSGSSVIFANRDKVEHHIKSFSSSKPFEIAVHKPGDTPAPIRFDKEGAVVAYCILHDWMRAYVYVADTPWYGLTAQPTGIARIENVPGGDYEATAWHPDLGQYKPALMQKVTIPATGSADVTFKFEFKPRPIRQAPKLGGSTKTAALHQHH
jgi:plastocyanin